MKTNKNKYYEQKFLNFFCMRSNKKCVRKEVATKELPTKSTGDISQQTKTSSKKENLTPNSLEPCQHEMKKKEVEQPMIQTFSDVPETEKQKEITEAQTDKAEDKMHEANSFKAVSGDKEAEITPNEDEVSCSDQQEPEEQVALEHIINNVLELETFASDSVTKPKHEEGNVNDLVEESNDDLKPEPISPSTAVDSSYCFQASSTTSELVPQTKSEETLPITENGYESHSDALKQTEELLEAQEIKAQTSPLKSKMFTCCQAKLDPSIEMTVAEPTVVA